MAGERSHESGWVAREVATNRDHFQIAVEVGEGEWRPCAIVEEPAADGIGVQWLTRDSSGEARCQLDRLFPIGAIAEGWARLQRCYFDLDLYCSVHWWHCFKGAGCCGHGIRENGMLEMLRRTFPSKARYLDYFGDWKTVLLNCPSCRWQGVFDQCGVEVGCEVMEAFCPRCADPQEMLAIVELPPLPEAEERWRELDDDDQLVAAAMRHLRNRFLATRLKWPEELPDVGASRFSVLWDSVDRFTVLRVGDQELWREPTIFAGRKRFHRVVHLLRHRYGARLVDVIPTP